MASHLYSYHPSLSQSKHSRRTNPPRSCQRLLSTHHLHTPQMRSNPILPKRDIQHYRQNFRLNPIVSSRLFTLLKTSPQSALTSTLHMLLNHHWDALYHSFHHKPRTLQPIIHNLLTTTRKDLPPPLSPPVAPILPTPAPSHPMKSPLLPFSPDHSQHYAQPAPCPSLSFPPSPPTVPRPK